MFNLLLKKKKFLLSGILLTISIPIASACTPLEKISYNQNLNSILTNLELRLNPNINSKDVLASSVRIGQLKLYKNNQVLDNIYKTSWILNPNDNLGLLDVSVAISANNQTSFTKNFSLFNFKKNKKLEIDNVFEFDNFLKNNFSVSVNPLKKDLLPSQIKANDLVFAIANSDLSLFNLIVEALIPYDDIGSLDIKTAVRKGILLSKPILKTINNLQLSELSQLTNFNNSLVFEYKKDNSTDKTSIAPSTVKLENLVLETLKTNNNFLITKTIKKADDISGSLIIDVISSSNTNSQIKSPLRQIILEGFKSTLDLNKTGAETDLARFVSLRTTNKENAVLTKYQTIMDGNETKHAFLKDNAFAVFAYAVEMSGSLNTNTLPKNKSSSTTLDEDTVLEKIKTWLNKKESKDFSKLTYVHEILRTNDLKAIASKINKPDTVKKTKSKLTEPNFDESKAKNLVKNVLTKVIDTYYYGTKKINDKNIDYQKIYHNPIIYEDNLPGILSDVIILVNNKSVFDSNFYTNYNNALNYFLKNITYLRSNDSSRYITNTIPKQTINSTSANFAAFTIKNAAYKFGSSYLAKNKIDFANTIYQMLDWFKKTNDYDPFSSKSPFRDSYNMSNVDDTKKAAALKTYQNTLNFLRLVLNFINKVNTNTPYNSNFETFFNYVKTNLLVTYIKNENINKTVNLNILGQILFIDTALKKSEMTTKVKQLLESKTETELTCLSKAYTFIQTELKKHLKNSKTAVITKSAVSKNVKKTPTC